MLIFALVAGAPRIQERELAAAVSQAAGAHLQMDPNTLSARSAVGGRVRFATIEQRTELTAPRRYRAERGTAAVFFDGLPVDPRGRFAGYDAAALLAHWDDLDDLEGQFSAVRVDLSRGYAVIRTDTFGLSPLYARSLRNGQIVSNSIAAIRSLVTKESPDELGVASLLGIGWTVDDRTLLRGIRVLRGGHRYTAKGGELTSVPLFTPASAARVARSRERPDMSDLVKILLTLTSGVASSGIPIKCALTGGRDSRLLLALVQAVGAHARCYTVGRPSDEDVQIAQQVAAVAGVEHEVWAPDAPSAPEEWPQVAWRFVNQTDGLSPFVQIGDQADQLVTGEIIGAKLSGLGGEIGRSRSPFKAFAAHAPIVTRSAHVQERLLIAWLNSFQGLITPAALNEVAVYLRSFVRLRRAEGWYTREVSEAFYAFDRVSRWGSAAVRRTSSTDDMFSPFCTQAFVRYCFSLSSGERYNEAAHYRLLSVLSPKLRDLKFAKPWKPQRRRLAPLAAGVGGARLVVRRAAGGRRVFGGGTPTPAATLVPGRVPGPAYRWLESHLEAHREVCLSRRDSPLWAYVDRQALERAFRVDVRARAPLTEGLLRVLTVFWYFHGGPTSADAPA